MNKSDLITVLSKESGLMRTKVEEVANRVFNDIANSRVDGDRVEIRGFCSMFVKEYKGYNGRNPKTGKISKVKPKKMLFFRCGKDLKGRVDGSARSERRSG